MQLSRVIIAAVFFIIGMLIAIPALFRATSQPSASSTTPSASASLTPTTSPRPSGGVSPGRTARASTTPVRTPTPTPTPSRRTATPGPTRLVPPPTRTAVPALPLKAVIGPVKCPGRGVKVTVTNAGDKVEDYAIEMDGSANTAGRLKPRESYSRTLVLDEGVRTEVAVTWNNQPVRSVVRKADCTDTGAEADRLPRTGPGDAGLYAKTATGIAAMITGLIIFWWGGTWPRRREQVFPGRRRS